MPRPSIRTLRFFLVLGVCVLLTLACRTGHVVTSGWRARKLPWSPDEASDCCGKYYAPALSQDSRGWLLDPISAASRAGISGAATTCEAVHVGQIKSGFIRGNHRHHFCNETFIVWGARAKFRVENPSVTKGYTEIVINMDEVGVLGGPAGRAHALVNMDNTNTLHFLGCQDASADPSNTDYNVWTNLKAA